MSVILYDKPTDQAQLYPVLRRSLREILAVEPDQLAILANTAAIFGHYLDDINWVGFYRVAGEHLILGPFQGKPACPRLVRGVGVCAAAWEKDEIVRVDDVDTFVGHVACDSASAAEIVLPIHEDGAISWVLDIDSPTKGRFREHDEAGLTSCRRVIEHYLRRSSCK